VPNSESSAVANRAVPQESGRAAARARLDAVLRPFVLGSGPQPGGGLMTGRRVAETARDAAAAVVPLLGEPRRSAHRVRGVIAPVLTCRWADFDDVYAAALDALLALPPAVRGVDDPAWDAGLPVERAAPAQWVNDGRRWTPPEHGADAVGPAGLAGRVVRRGAQSVLITADGRPVRLRGRCECEPAERGARAAVPFEHVHLRRDGAIVDVAAGLACGSCRAPIE
jgi:hypothetical protein